MALFMSRLSGLSKALLIYLNNFFRRFGAKLNWFSLLFNLEIVNILQLWHYLSRSLIQRVRQISYFPILEFLAYEALLILDLLKLELTSN